jgi:hypothetical protein
MDKPFCMEREGGVPGASGLPKVQSEKPKWDLIEQAAARMRMTRPEFIGMFEGVGDESIEQRARRIVGGGSTLLGMLDRGIADPPREPTMNARGRRKFR